MSDNKKEKKVSIFVPHLGCPHDCAYCNQEKITGLKKSVVRSIAEIEQEIKKQLESIDCNQNHVGIAFFGGSFTGLPHDYQIQLLELGTKYVNHYSLQGIRFSTRPDYINADVLKNLQGYPIEAIELGVQSLDSQVLQCSNRGHSVQDVYQAVSLIRETPYLLGIQLMVGLPFDSLEISIKTAQEVIRLAPDFVRIYPTLVLQGTELEQLYQKGLYTPWSLQDTIENTAKMVRLFYQSNIPIIRLGLQASEELQETGAVIAGPYHPNIRQLIESQYFLDLLLELSTDSFSGNDDLIYISIHPSDETAFRGQGNQNLQSFMDKFRKKIILVKDSTQRKKTFSIIESL
ncbi:hypothetical protein BHU72_03095 [Desulfuribacillus stibiiarsenatis]|uniref:Radical SAM core domain-containing protein n=2 Tax=Desulfuribacillus stibiiarsenatis TaxID=1390249 RepID=A0A1E5L740_9FIRM|nr:hypothetical protein BHU72_03095 [Desulfuribacillus stibiiarsenatis]